MRVSFLAVAAGAGLLIGPSLAVPTDRTSGSGAAFAKEPPPDPPANPAGAPPAAGPASPTPKPMRAVTPKEKADLTALFGRFMNREAEDAYKHKQPLLEYILKLKETGYDPLGDLDTLTGILYATRIFKPPYERKFVEKDDKIHADPLNRLTSIVVRDPNGDTESLRMAFSLPATYPEPKKLTTVKPYPTIVTLGEIVPDYQEGKLTKEWPGEEVIKRRYGKNGPLKSISEEWMVLAPVTARAQFMVDGKVNVNSVLKPLSQFWQRYHIDYDRVVLDGGEEALQLAASQPIWFGGLIVRNGEKLEFDPDLVRNFAHIPVYVVGTDDCLVVKALKQGGYDEKNLKVGKEDGIAEWSKGVRRVTPKTFHWNVKDPQRHVLAHWINVNEVLPGAPERTLDVSVVDTAEDPNTVKIDAVGIANITIFLSDRIVDLNREVRIVVNGHPLLTPPAKYERKLDNMFQAKRLDILKSLYYGWLYPITIEDVKVPEKAPRPKVATPPPTADQEQEAKAVIYFNKAKDFEAKGDLPSALKYYEKAAEQGETSVKIEAEAKKKEISEKVPK